MTANAWLMLIGYVVALLWIGFCLGYTAGVKWQFKMTKRAWDAIDRLTAVPKDRDDADWWKRD